MSITYPKKKRLSNLPPFWFLLLSKKSSMARCMYIFFCFRLSLSFSTPWQQPATLDENKTRGFPNVHSDTYTPPSVLCLEGGGGWREKSMGAAILELKWPHRRVPVSFQLWCARAFTCVCGNTQTQSRPLQMNTHTCKRENCAVPVIIFCLRLKFILPSNVVVVLNVLLTKVKTQFFRI